MLKIASALVALSLMLGGIGVSARAAEADGSDFFKGKTITITSAGGPGGSYGIYALLLSEHLGKYLNGAPQIIVNYMQGASGVRAANYLYNVAPKDGTALLAPLQNMATFPLIEPGTIHYDPTKFNWIGRAVDVASVFVVKKDVIASLDQLRKRTTDVIVGVPAAGSPSQIMPAMVGYGLGVKLKLVAGYNGSNAVALAYERNEIQGLGLPWESLRISHPDILKDTIIVQSGFEPHPDYPEVPLLIDLVKDPDRKAVVELFQIQESVGRSFVAPPGVKAERVAMLRHAFDRTVKDPDFLAAAKKRHIEINPRSGEEMQKLVERQNKFDASLIKRAKAAIFLKD
jgi:tripartite-type tricarboxylate transporter receptor subunit TctC